jgi:hypothetical protein
MPLGGRSVEPRRFPARAEWALKGKELAKGVAEASPWGGRRPPDRDPGPRGRRRSGAGHGGPTRREDRPSRARSTASPRAGPYSNPTMRSQRDLAGEKSAPRSPRNEPGGTSARMRGGRAGSRGLSGPWQRCSAQRPTQVLQRSLDPRVAPRGILRGHPQNERRDLPHDPRTAWSLRLERPLPGDQVTVPPEDCVGGHDRGDLTQDASTESALRREAATLVIG